MKRIAALALLAVMLTATALAGRPTPTAVDTISHNSQGRPEKFVAYYMLTLSTTPDTLDLPAPGGMVDLVHRGSTAGTDTVQASIAMAGKAVAYSIRLTSQDQTYRYDARGPYVRRVIIKASGTVPVWLWVSY